MEQFGAGLPAAMKLLGEWNWYLPSWLEWLPKGPALEGSPPPPASADADVEDRAVAA